MKFREQMLYEASEEALWNEMGKLLKSHDWMFSMSNGNAWEKGNKEAKKILKLRKELREIDKQKLIDLYKSNVPKHVLNAFSNDWEEIL